MDANNNYKRRNYDRMSLLLPKGAKEKLKEIADAEGISVTRYIHLALEEKSGLKLTLDNALPWMQK